jgi:rhodanese-related sulfurtransferase
MTSGRPAGGPGTIDVMTAHRLLQEEPGAVYLDVRTEEEFAAGHPRGAANIPIGVPDPSRTRLLPNPEFLAVARAAFPRDTPLLVGCRTGPRAEAAAHLLAEDGYSSVRWVAGGYDGIVDHAGVIRAPGWRTLGLPEDGETEPGAAHRALRRKAGLD